MSHPSVVQSLPAQISLVDLLELAARQHGVSVQYERAALKGEVSLRLDRPVDSREIWALCLSVLESQGFAVVPTDVEGVLRVLPLQRAAQERAGGDARVRAGEPSAPRPGNFSSVIIEIEHVGAESAAAAIQPLLTPNIGTARSIAGGRFLLVSDVSRRLDLALGILADFDRPSAPVQQRFFDTQYVLAAEMARQIDVVMGAGVKAQVVSAPPLVMAISPRRLLVQGMPEALERVAALIEELDRGQGLEVRTYAVANATPEELRDAIVSVLGFTQSGAAPPPASTTARADIERLTGLVLVTATPSEHARIAELIDRLAAMPLGAANEMRLIEVRNRDAADLLTLLGRVQEVPFSVAASPASPEPSRSISDIERASGVSVDPPSPELQRAVPGAAARAPQEAPTLTVDSATNTIVAVGRPSMLDRIEALVQRLDRRQPQVMIEVTLVSLSEGRALDFGVELRTQFENGGTTTNLASAFGLAADGALAMGTGFTGTIIRPGDFEVVVRALETTSSGRAVSAPKILVDNNQSSSLRSVARQPFTSINASSTVATTSFGGTEDAGTTITVTPHIAQGDHLSVEYTIEVSAFTGDSITTEGGGVVPPPSQQNSIDGSVTIPDGFAVVVGGLRSQTTGESDARVPLLGRIPLLGPLFGTHGDNDSSTRLYIFIQATILRDAEFAGLRNLSASDLATGGVDDGTPKLSPLWIE